MLNLEQGKELRDDGIRRVSYANEDFIEVMREAARELMNQKTWITMDDVRVWAEEHGIEPTHPNAWGAIFRHRDFEPCGFRNSEQPQRHGAMIRVWRMGDPMKLPTINIKRGSK